MPQTKILSDLKVRDTHPAQGPEEFCPTASFSVRGKSTSSFMRSFLGNKKFVLSFLAVISLSEEHLHSLGNYYYRYKALCTTTVAVEYFHSLCVEASRHSDALANVDKLLYVAARLYYI